MSAGGWIICIPGVITFPGLGDGDAAGICMPGVITWGLREGEGDAVGICMPGVITWGLGEGEACGLAAVGFRVAGRRALARVRRFGAAFGFGLAAAGFSGMTCPSC